MTSILLFLLIIGIGIGIGIGAFNFFVERGFKKLRKYLKRKRDASR